MLICLIAKTQLNNKLKTTKFYERLCIMFLLIKKATIKALAAALAVALSITIIVKKNFTSYKIEPITLTPLGNPPTTGVICNSQSINYVKQNDIDTSDNTSLDIFDIREPESQNSTLDQYNFYDNKIICEENQYNIDYSSELMDMSMHDIEATEFYDLNDDPFDANFTREMCVYKFLNNVDNDILENPNIIENFLENVCEVSFNNYDDNKQDTTENDSNNINNELETLKEENQPIEDNANTASLNKKKEQIFDESIKVLYNSFNRSPNKFENTIDACIFCKVKEVIKNKNINKSLLNMDILYFKDKFPDYIKTLKHKVYKDLNEIPNFDPVNNIDHFKQFILKSFEYIYSNTNYFEQNNINNSNNINSGSESLITETPSINTNSKISSDEQAQHNYGKTILKLHDFVSKSQDNLDNVMAIYIFSILKNVINNSQYVNNHFLNMDFKTFKNKYHNDIKTFKSNLYASLNKNSLCDPLNNIDHFQNFLIEISKQLSENPSIFKLYIPKESFYTKNNSKTIPDEYKLIDPKTGSEYCNSEKMLNDIADNALKCGFSTKDIIFQQLYTLFYSYDINIQLINKNDCEKFAQKLASDLNKSFNNQSIKAIKECPILIKQIAHFINNHFHEIKICMIYDNYDIYNNLNLNEFLTQLHSLTKNNTNISISNNNNNSINKVNNTINNNNNNNIDKIKSNNTISNNNKAYVCKKMYNNFLNNEDDIHSIIASRLHVEFLDTIKSVSNSTNDLKIIMKTFNRFCSYQDYFAQKFISYMKLDLYTLYSPNITLDQFSKIIEQIDTWISENFDDLIIPMITNADLSYHSFISADLSPLIEANFKFKSNSKTNLVKSISQFHKVVKDHNYKIADVVFSMLCTTLQFDKEYSNFDNTTLEKFAVYISKFLNDKPRIKSLKDFKVFKSYLQTADKWICNNLGDFIIKITNDKQNNIDNPFQSDTNLTSLDRDTWNKESIKINRQIIENLKIYIKIPNEDFQLFFSSLLANDTMAFLNHNLPSNPSLSINDLSTFMEARAQKHFNTLYILYKYIKNKSH